MDIDFFISYASKDLVWAEWIAWQLEAANYTTVMQGWDFVPGSNFVLEMDHAARNARQTIAILTPTYLERLFTQAEWAAAFKQSPTGKGHSLLPVRVEECDLYGLLAQIVYIDLVDTDEKEARRRLLQGVGGKRSKPLYSPSFPGHALLQHGRHFPGNQKLPFAEATFSTRGFVCACMTASGILDLEMPVSPYRGAFDPTDQESGFPRRGFIVLWMPRCEVIVSPSTKTLTPVVAICTLDPESIVKTIEHASQMAIKFLEEKPRNLRKDVREDIIEIVAEALRDSFVAVVTIPPTILEAGRRNPLIAYQAMMNLFFFPLLDMHRKLGISEVRIWIADTGKLEADLLKIAKRGAKALFPSKQSITVDLVSKNDFWLPFSNICRLLAWIVNAHYNWGNGQWLATLRDKLESFE